MTAGLGFSNPFVTRSVPGVGPVQACDAQSRIDMVASFNVDQCARAMKVPYLQKTVKAAIARRVRQLAAAPAANQAKQG